MFNPRIKMLYKHALKVRNPMRSEKTGMYQHTVYMSNGEHVSLPSDPWLLAEGMLWSEYNAGNK